MKKINLEDILESAIIKSHDDGELSFSTAVDAMREACKQTLMLAVENAKTIDKWYPGAIGGGPYTIVNKQSILDTINNIE